MNVTLVEAWGSDESIIEDARMSTSGAFKGWDKDEKLLRYLWENKHLSPFEGCGAKFEVEAPIFVAREWMRHRTQSFNEMSARYIEIPEKAYIPSMSRLLDGGQSKTNKQASGSTLPESVAREARQEIVRQTEVAFESYRHLLSLGVSRELARSVLPVNTMTWFRATANLRNWLHFLDLRTDAAAQLEIRSLANDVATLLSQKFPRTLALWQERR